MGDKNKNNLKIKRIAARTNYLIFILFIWHLKNQSEAGIACLSNPCLFGLCVDDVNSSYSCYCMDGYTGNNCQTEWNECWSQPCFNGGECIDLVASYNCTCPEGFSGPSCEFNRDECLSQPCVNNATCIDGSNGFQCHCLPGYDGLFCELDMSVCNSSDTERCFNGGVCKEGPGDKFWCTCHSGWGGQFCEEPLDPCLLQPCVHGGLCLTQDIGYICACPFGYSGTRCEDRLNLCTVNPCLNGAICIEEDDGSSICYCVPDFHGDLCQYQYNECLLPPAPSCKNGGTCIDGVDGFTCNCPDGIHGKYCQCLDGDNCTLSSFLPDSSTYITKIPFVTTLTPTATFSISRPLSTTARSTIQFTRKTSKIPITLDKLSTTEKFVTSYLNSTISLNDSNVISVFSTEPSTTKSTELNFTVDKSAILPKDDKIITTTIKSDDSEKNTTIVDKITTINITIKPDTSEDENTIEDTTEIVTTEMSEDVKTVSDIDKTNTAKTTTVDIYAEDKINSVFTSTITESSLIIPTTITNTFSEKSTPDLNFVSTFSSSDVTLNSETYRTTTSFILTSESRSSTSINIPSSADDEKTFVSKESHTTTDSYDNTPTQNVFSSLLTLVTKQEQTTESSEITTIDATSDTASSDSKIIIKTTINDKPHFGYDEHVFETSSTLSSEVTTISKEDLPSTTTDKMSPNFDITITYSPNIPNLNNSFRPTTFLTTTGYSTLSKFDETTLSTELSKTTTEIEKNLCTTSEAGVCKSGGTCISTDRGVHCKCPLQFEGQYCERPSNLTEISLLSTSWILFRVVTPTVESLDDELSFSHRFQVTIRIASEDGIIFTIVEAEEGELPRYNMQLSLAMGKLRLHFSCGLQSVRFSESKQRIDTGFPTNISASLTVWSGSAKSGNSGRCKAELRINNTLAVSGEQLTNAGSIKSHNTLAHLVFGSWPRNPMQGDSDAGITTAPGVISCISNVIVNNKPRYLLADITAGTNDVSECTQLSCLSNPCLFGGSCHENSVASWSCQCPSGWLGTRCEKSVCENSPCFGGGTCLVHPGTNFVCLCPFGRQGIFCEQEIKITKPCMTPALIGALPYLAFPLNPKHISFRHSLEMKLKFKPASTHQVAILAYIGHGPEDHLALSYVHGRIMLTWDLGTGARRMFTSREFVSGNEHEVVVRRSGRDAWLSVIGDNTTLYGHSVGRMNQLNTRPVLLIGGFDRGNTSLLPHDLPKHSGFEGCITNIEFRTGNQITKYFPSEVNALRGRSVSQEGIDICSVNTCLHQGICLPHGPSFTCLCAEGWYGPICSDSQNPCNENAHMCAEGSTCVPLLKGYECDCPLGKTGPYCQYSDPRPSLVWPEVYFSGKRSYLEIQRQKLSDPPEHSCVEFDIKSNFQIGHNNMSQIIFFSQDPVTMDFMSLILLPETDMLFILGSGETALVSLRSVKNNFIRPGVWIRVRAGRVGRRVFLSVGGRPVSSWLLPGQAGELWNGGSTAPLYLGGAPDLAKVAPLVWSPVTSFVGCIRRLNVDWRKVLIHVGKVKRRQTRFVEIETAQLTPEYYKQIQTFENISSMHIHNRNKNLIKKDIDKLTMKRINYANKSSFKGKMHSEFNEVEEIRKSKDRGGILLSRPLRSKDTLFVVGGRNVGPCEKSSPVTFQLERTCEIDSTLDECQNLNYKLDNEISPRFNGSGWMMIETPINLDSNNPLPFSYLNIQFSTKKPDGIVIWAKLDSPNEPFVGVGLEEGSLRIVWGSSSNSKTALTTANLADDGLHSVSILWVRNGESSESLVWIDGEREEVSQEHERVRRKRQHDSSIYPKIKIFIGGYPSDDMSISQFSNGNFHSSFSGCIYEMSWDDDTANLSQFTSYPHENVLLCKNNTN